MPSKNRVKIYVENAYYHVYNRGVAKQEIFREIQDYKVFLKYLKDVLTENKINKIPFSLRGRSFQATERQVKNFQNQIALIAFCLIPNHFHLLIKQKNKESMESFMRSLITRYASYFNKKYDRVGPVFQGRYKAALIRKDEYLLHLTRYIHLNPLEYTKDLTKAFSSYSVYVGMTKTSWVQPEFILKFFNNPVIPELTKISDYKSFVENYKKDSVIVLGDLTLE